MSRISLIALIFILSGCQSEYPSTGVLWNDFKARVDIKLEKYEEALQKYFEVIASWPGGVETHSNVGVLLSQLQKNEDALKSFDEALLLADQKKDLKAMFYVLFNKGVYYGKLKNVEQALNSYQAALEIVPTSVETKTNIELLIQQQQKDQKDKKDKQDQDKKDGQGESDQKSDPKDGDKGQDPKDDKKDQKDQKDKDEQNKDQDQKDQQDQDKKNQERESSAKYKPRPYQGDQLSEGDVKKILGELRNQEQKIRANFDKKEKGKSGRNEKDW
ncbi:MAG: tetratricopeptide repeat protein [Bdellovibrionaceae bacterium]|nr:tetratricopeptide repeat protein [Pseudobdellovibrionaceae bacterium]